MMLTFRAEKTTQNKDDLRVLMVGIMLAILMMVTKPFMEARWDDYISKRPFVSATVEVIRSPSSGEILIKYDADAEQEVDGFWVASVIDVNDIQLSTRKGDGSYNPKVDNPRVWTWEAFFDSNKGTPAPEIPSTIFKVCVRYIVLARDTLVSDETELFCSPFFKP